MKQARNKKGDTMSGRLEGKVAFITGAARGQGRSHAVRLAQEGADIIAVDLMEQIESNPYPLATPEDMKETVRLVEAQDRRIIASKADVRSRDQLREAVANGVAQLGRLDILCANAGILPMAMGDPHPLDFVDATDVDLIGVMNAVAVTIPHLTEYGSIIVTGSTAAMLPNTTEKPPMGPGRAGSRWGKNTLMGYVE